MGRFPGSLHIAGFFDYGYANLHVSPIAPDNNRFLAGAGFGLNWFDADSFSARTTLAWRTVGNSTGQSERSEPTIYFQMTKRF